MSIFRYIVQGIGWEIGSQAAREGIDALKEKDDEAAPPLTEREQKLLDKERAKAAARATQEREEIIAKKRARIEAELRELKKKA